MQNDDIQAMREAERLLSCIEGWTEKAYRQWPAETRHHIQDEAKSLRECLSRIEAQLASKPCVYCKGTYKEIRDSIESPCRCLSVADGASKPVVKVEECAILMGEMIKHAFNEKAIPIINIAQALLTNLQSIGVQMEVVDDKR